jgi:hypothetical protein
MTLRFSMLYRLRPSLALVAVLVGAALLPACAGSLPMPYAAVPAVPARAPIAEANPVAPTGDAALDDFLSELAAAIDRKDWRGVATRFERPAFAEQVAFVTTGAGSTEAAAAQVIAESLGLSALATYTAASDTDPYAGLDRIVVVTFRDARRAGDRVDIQGDVRLPDGQTIPLSFSVTPARAGFAVLVPRG